jgi:hypothetical protein
MKGLYKAEASDLPDLAVIVGPNGSGKSTVLYELWRNRNAWAEPGTRVMYINPNRPWRRSQLSAASLYGLALGYRQLMETETAPGFQYVAPQGYVQTGQPRTPDTTDDAQGLVKFSVVKMESKRQRLISKVFDESGGQIAPGTVADVFGPLRELIDVMLPHLDFIGVDSSDDADQRCLFRKLDSPDMPLLDIDDLSSGEKAAIQLFLPFIEEQINQLLAAGTSIEADASRSTALIDEPELHIHPSLQISLVAYMRQITQRGDAQFIVATHSTTIMDALEDDELFMLAPPSSVGVGSQLRRLAATGERLELVREITGSTHIVTRCRPIIFIEGERPGTKTLADQRIIELLIPEAKKWVLVPSQGRTQVIAGARALRDPALTELPGIAVFALVDHDEEEPTTEDFVITWPVCMIENLLLEPQALWRLVEPIKERVGLASEEEIRTILDGIVTDRKEGEIEMRVLRHLAQPRFNIRIRSVADLTQLNTATAEIVESYKQTLGGEDTVSRLTDAARVEVETILESGKALERFHGKTILKEFYEQAGKRGGWSYTTFAYMLAREVSGSSRLRSLIELPVRRLRQFVPAQLCSSLESCRDVLEGDVRISAQEASGVVATMRRRWEQGEEDETDRAALRRNILNIGRVANEGGNAGLYADLLRQLVQLGDG